MNALINLAIMLFVLASVQMWILAAVRFWTGKSSLVYEPRHPVPWGLGDILMAIVLQMVVHNLAHEWFRREHEFSEPFQMQKLGIEVSASYVGVMAWASLGALVLTIGWLLVRHRSTPADLGIRIRSVGLDLVLGLRAFVMLAPVVYTIKFVLSPLATSEHPLIEMLRKNPSTRFFVLSGFAAVIVAPLVEEYFFRVLLQGWFERLATGLDNTWQIFFGGATVPRKTECPVAGEVISIVEASAGVESAGIGNGAEETTVTPAGRASRWPIAASAALFGLAHASSFPDPIPLFVLALGLGYLYQRTHRILPSIIVHFLLNGTTLMMMWLVMRNEQ